MIGDVLRQVLEFPPGRIAAGSVIGFILERLAEVGRPDGSLLDEFAGEQSVVFGDAERGGGFHLGRGAELAEQSGHLLLEQCESGPELRQILLGLEVSAEELVEAGDAVLPVDERRGELQPGERRLQTGDASFQSGALGGGRLAASAELLELRSEGFPQEQRLA